MKKITIIGIVVSLIFAAGCIPLFYTVGGTVNGLTGTVNLTNTDTGESIDVNSDTFSFSAQKNNTTYTVIVSAQPEGQICTVNNGSGVISGATVNNILVECLTNWLGTQQFGTENTESINGIDVAADDSVILFGSGYNVSTSQTEGAIWMRAASGDPKWTFFDSNRNGRVNDAVVSQEGSIYAVGEAGGDAYILKVSTDGEVEWRVTLEGDNYDVGTDILIRSNGQLVVCGYTFSSTFEGQSNAGRYDVFVTQVSTSGVVGWTTLLGDSNNDNDGALTETPNGDLVVAYSNHIYYSYEPLSGHHIINLTKLDPNGTVVMGWPVILHETDEEEMLVGKVAINSEGDIFVAGSTHASTFFGVSNSGSSDVFIIKASSTDGEPIWGRLFGSSEPDTGYSGVSLDSMGNLLITGGTSGTLPGQLSSGDLDIFVAKWDQYGNPLWIRQVGTADRDHARGVAVDSWNQILIGGSTDGDLDGNTSHGYSDAFLMKLDSDTGNIVQPTTTP